ncbi:glycosyltransferase family 2 protein [Scytonema millei]|uniref:Glycosyltransferase family 2 protein n=1 Tax=Scytonema millei VB511283 TaxID=1245923 RepID=A0A9X5E133_9CYAN|nr:glycosyltransferase family 2 protein [Scytonema millei]NHC33309.1 glycosyltransferase family 2 protein [Scytonema millei VB511283]
MMISVLIPTYRRSQDLARCLVALQQQARPADEVLVVVRDSDTETWQLLAGLDPHALPLRTVKVSVPGVVAAMNAGVDVAKGEIIAITDDDAAPHADWLERIEAHYLADEKVGGVGGRDRMHYGVQLVEGQSHIVGRLQWFGRAIGNHHLGVGNAREVDILKGVNSSYRRSAIAHIRFDERMRGTGAQVHHELMLCLTLKRAGWKLIYDPAIVVDHYLGQRFDEDRRNQFNAIAFSNMTYNETLSLLEHLSPIRRIAFAIWALLVGTRDAWGLVQLLRFLPSQGKLAWQKWLASMHGRWQAWLTWSNRDRSSEVWAQHL